MFKFLSNIPNIIKRFFVTNSGQKPQISHYRDITTTDNRDITTDKLITDSFSCPYCSSTCFVKKGFRIKKRERVQLYRCSSCHKVFTPYLTKGKRFPMAVIFDAVSIYNLGYSLEETVNIVLKRTGVALPVSSLALWLKEFGELCRFSRMREYALKKYSPKNMVIYATLAHQQMFRYRFHQAKCELIISEDFKHHRFGPLKEFLEMVPVECPHQYFNTGLRASEVPLKFSKKQMIVRAKQNYATKLTAFVLQSVKERKLRHEALQKFMLANDSVTVATEVPVYLTRDDLLHMQTQLGFEIYEAVKTPRGWQAESHDSPEVEGTNCETIANSSMSLGDLPKLITGHIDILQIRNGQIHILDYKANAEKEQPIEQLTLYAMALSRLTGLRMFEFKCAWFDEKDYFEFYPLHVIHKPRKSQRRRKVYTMEGTYKINENPKKIERIRPIA